MNTAKIVVLAIGIGFLSNSGSACRCVESPASMEALFSTHQLVFVGEVVRVTEVTEDANHKKLAFAYRELVISISEVFKGDLKQKEIKMPSAYSSCDAGFGLGGKYLIYGRSYQNRLASDVCDQSKKLPSAAADADLKWIRRFLKAKKAGAIKHK